MNPTTQPVNLNSLFQAFNKIYNGLDKTQLAETEKEMQKIIPSANSEVFLAADYDDTENSMGMSVYVSNPETNNSILLTFDKIITDWLMHSDINRLPNILECIQLMERKGSDNYEIDFIPVAYNKELGDYTIHFRITKNVMQYEKKKEKRA